MKLTISMDDNLVKRMDEAADLNYMSRSGFISHAVSQYLIQQDSVIALNKMSLALNKIADSDSFDDVDLSELNEVRNMLNLVLSKK